MRASWSATISATGARATRKSPESHHDHLIDVQSGSVIEFRNDDIEKLQRRVAEELGFELVDHRLELYGVPKANRAEHRLDAHAARVLRFFASSCIVDAGRHPCNGCSLRFKLKRARHFPHHYHRFLCSCSASASP